MLELSRPSEGLLFFSFLYRSDLFVPDLFLKRCQSLFGEVISFYPQFNPLSTYYAQEMGDSAKLKRLFMIPVVKFPREFLLTTKLLALEWEREWSVAQARMANVDIGFLSLENFILATTKNYSHRVYLGQNIFADLTYQFSEGKLQDFPWTYPDFKDQEKKDFFLWCRSFLLMHGKVKTS